LIFYIGIPNFDISLRFYFACSGLVYESDKILERFKVLSLTIFWLISYYIADFYMLIVELSFLLSFRAMALWSDSSLAV
jgi:hypothetical protein